MFTDILLQQGLFILLAIFASGAFGSLVLMKNDSSANQWSGFTAAVGSFVGILFSSNLLLSEKAYSFVSLNIFSIVPVSVKIDTLSAFFMLVISTIAFLSAIYSLGYMKQFYGKYNIGVFGFFYNIFIASMLLVVTANNALYFLLVWEIMSLASYFLVIFEHKHEESVQAGFLYLIMTHLATGAILFGFLLLYGTSNSFDFDAIRAQAGNLPANILAAVSLLMIVGFGTKAGIIPFHIWLPKAHPAAPSHISALMSGVMIKTGVFMIVRLFFDLIPGTPNWVGYLILIIGAISALLGVLYALSEHDLKKLLAYHSVENIGIIFMGIGSALIFIGLGFKSIAAIALVGALFHTMNHAIFKSLLFLSAGSVVSATHTRNIEEYGGLIKLMPFTSLFFLIGAMAISALPPFNGFASEWLVFQALFAGVVQQDMATRIVFIFAIVSLAFTGGLAAACFVKAFGISFLAKPRSKESLRAKETGISMQFGMAVLSALCLILGVFSNFIVLRLEGVISALSVFSKVPSDIIFSGRTVAVRDNFAALSLSEIFIALVIAILAVYMIFNYISRKQKEKIYGTWDCGATLNSRMEITATSFSRSIIAIFSSILKPTKQIDIEYQDAHIRYFTKSSTVTLGIGNLYKKYLYDPVYNATVKIADQAKEIQSGNINTYILYIFVTIIILLVWISL